MVFYVALCNDMFSAMWGGPGIVEIIKMAVQFFFGTLL
jgi:hypothetical protein